jgi:hypothetical protein
MRSSIILFLSLLLSIEHYAQVRINEIVSLNSSTLADEQNNYPDWIELYNPTSDSLSLANYYLSDNKDNHYKWQLPNIYLQAFQHKVFFASGQDLENHTNFKISSRGESLYLSNSSGLVDSLPAVTLQENQSFGRFPDGSNNIGKLYFPTPKSANDSIQFEFSALSFSHTSGFYENTISLSISPTNPHAEIYYTADGTVPSPSENKYISALKLDDLSQKENEISEIPTADSWQSPKARVFKGHILKTAAYKDGQRISPVYTHSFFIYPKMKERYSFPIVSLSTAPENLFDEENGIYVKGQNTNYSQRGRTWEREVQFEYFDLYGKRQVNQSVGLRINGNISRNFPQKSMLLYARESYGKSRLKHSFFEDKENDSFKRIILRCASSNDWKNTMFKNELAQRIVIDMNLEHPASQEVIVFINGEYWGIHHLNERTDEHFINDYYDEENINLLTHDAQIEEGSNTDFIRLRDYITQHDLDQEEHYQYVSTQIDIDNVIDYYCAQLFLANTDWPHNNVKYWKNQDDGQWRWLFFDCDECMSYEYYNLMADLINEKNIRQDFPEWSIFIMRNLLKNKTFRLAFRQRFERLLNTTFSSQNLMQHIQAMESLYRAEIVEHSLRWNVPSNINDWEGAVASLYSFAAIRPTIMKKQLNDYFGNPFTVYPNPTNDLLNIDLSVQDNHFERLSIKNSLGKELMSFNQKWTNPIALHHLKSGVYFIEIQLQGHSYTERLLVF